MTALVIAVVLLLLGWCLGTRQIELEATAKSPCGCERCWYVGEPPVTAPLCFKARELGVKELVLFGGVAALAFLLMRRVAGKAGFDAGGSP